MSVGSLERHGFNPRDLAAIYVEEDGGPPKLGKVVVREGEPAPSRARGNYGVTMSRKLCSDQAEVYYRHGGGREEKCLMR